MTKISYIAGIGKEESAQRAQGIKPQPFIPYLSMTKGEMTLALMQEQANILAGFYGDPKYRQAEAMLENALYRGIHGATPYMGAYDPALTGIVRAINQARRERQPAAGGAVMGRQSMVNGIHVGEPVIDYEARGKACKAEAAKASTKNERERRAKECDQRFRIERILNDGIENCGQYLGYGYLPSQGINALPSVATFKILTQTAAQEDISRVGKFGMQLTQQWLNVGMMRRNADTAKVEPYGWIETNAFLTSLPEAGRKEVVALFQSIKSKQDKMGGLPQVTEIEVGKKLAAIVKKYQGVNGIGIAPIVAVAIFGAITALMGVIGEFAKSARAEQVDAFSQVNGFGTRAIGPNEGDWDGDGVPDNQQTATATDWTTPALLVGGAVVAWQLFK